MFGLKRIGEGSAVAPVNDGESAKVRVGKSIVELPVTAPGNAKAKSEAKVAEDLRVNLRVNHGER
jgi:hypothetical protein